MDWIGRTSFLAALFLTFFQGRQCVPQQSDLDYIASKLDVKVTITDNLQYDGAKHKFHVVLKNTGNQQISPDGWTIYFFSFFIIESDHLPSPEGYIVPHFHIKLNHVQGMLFTMEPTADFQPLGANESRILQFYGQNWAVSKTDVPSKWYVAAPGLTAKTIESTRTEDGFVTDFDTLRQWKRYRDDAYNPYTPQDRYRRYNVRNLNSHQNRIVPTPKQVVPGNGEVDITSWKIVTTSDLQNEANYLKDKLNLSVDVPSAIPDQQPSKTILLSTNPALSDNDESYTLNVHSQNETIVVIGRNKSGVFYGVQSLISLAEGSRMKVPAIMIADEPRYGFRSMYVDVARNFQSKESILRLLDAMATYKLNKFHIHLADDEGWRIEIPGIPELTEIGSKRCHDLNEDTCLIPQLGSGADTTTSGTGYYTVEDYKEIVDFAEKRHIEVIPEIDSPGHARAAIKAMEARYRKYNNTDMGKAMQYRLIDPDDTSEYSSVQIFNDNAINPCIESTYDFFQKVVSEIKNMQPSVRIYHFGGDEVAHGAWVNSSKCEALAAENEYYKNPKHLKEYFTRRIASITNRMGLDLAGWEDGLMNEHNRPFNRSFLDNAEVYGNAWQNVWEWGSARRAYDLANDNYRVIMSHATHLYFDHPYEPDPEERGLYWATRFTDSYKTFRFMPDNLYENIAYRRSGNPITREEVCKEDDRECPALMSKENIVGMQGHLWSETVLNAAYFDYMIFPRILALAERAWHKASWEDTQDKNKRSEEMAEDWERFANTVGHKELPRLTKLGIKYRVAPPGIIVEENVVRANSEFPGLGIEYSQDDGQTWKPLPLNWHVTPGMSAKVRTVSDDGTRYSREVTFYADERIPIPHQTEIDYIASSLDTEYEVVDNLINDGHNYTCRYYFKNVGTRDILFGNWNVYFHHIRLVQPDDFPYPDGYPLEDCKMRIFHVGGSLYRFAPYKDFVLKTAESTSCLVYAKYFQVARTDTMPNWYIGAEGMTPVVTKTTLGDSLTFVRPFVRQGQVQRDLQDRYGFYLPRSRFTYNSDVSDSGMVGKHVIPTPVDLSLDTAKTLVIDPEIWVVVESADFPNSVKYISDLFDITVNSTKPSAYFIEFVKGEVSPLSDKNETENEAYRIRVDTARQTIIVTASHEPGSFYALQTLRQLSQTTEAGTTLPEVAVEDQPRFRYRGMHVDVGRNFKSKSDIMKLLDVMALYKLNKFHFHLTEDEGWRVEIPGLEELTSIGSKRCHDPSEDHCTLPQLGSDPEGGSPGSGYYTVSDYQDILRYANERHIQVIPEVDMPGHCRAGMKAMEARYRKHMTYGNRTAAEEFLLTDIGDPSHYITVQWFTDNAINPCMASSYNFIRHVIQSFVKMHRDIQPLKLYHFGADEVAHGAWENSDACKIFIASSPGLNSVSDLRKYFPIEVAKLAEAEGLDVGAWEDGLMDRENNPFDINSFPNPQKKVYGYAWSNIWEAGNGDRAYRLANAGYRVVLAHATHLYFDHPYEPDSEERGYYWATRFTDTRKTFGYVPDNIYANADVTRHGAPLRPDQICKDVCLKLEKPENIEGIQGNMWGETVRTGDNMYAMIFPRMLALAERAWHKSSWENIEDKDARNEERDKEWRTFANALGHKHFAILDEMNITYRVPVPGAKETDNTIEVNTAIPGLTVQSSSDNMRTWSDVVDNKINTEQGGTFHLRTLSKDRKRSSRTIKITKASPKPTSSAPRLIFPYALLYSYFICKFFL